MKNVSETVTLADTDATFIEKEPVSTARPAKSSHSHGWLVVRSASSDAQKAFVHDFVAVWNKVMNLDRFDLLREGKIEAVPPSTHPIAETVAGD